MPRRKLRGRPLDGWLIIDKPPGLTSTDVVNRVRRAFDAQKAGHGGTLDPLATGVSSQVGGPGSHCASSAPAP
jgi:tRNA pseudouridine55 synthase